MCKSEGKISTGRRNRRWKENVITDLRRMRLEEMNWTHLLQYMDKLQAVVNTLMKVQ